MRSVLRGQILRRRSQFVLGMPRRHVLRRPDKVPARTAPRNTCCRRGKFVLGVRRGHVLWAARRGLVHDVPRPGTCAATGGQADECLKCGATSATLATLRARRDPNQSGMPSKRRRVRVRTGPRTGIRTAIQAECACKHEAGRVARLPPVLEVQWPRHARGELSRNEAFSGISAAFRAFDVNSDNHLSVTAARAKRRINAIINRGRVRRSTHCPRRQGGR